MVISTLAPANEDKIIALIGYILNVPSSQIHSYTHFQDDLHLDEIDRLLLIAKLESCFQVYLSNEDAASIETVRDASFFLLKYAVEAA